MKVIDLIENEFDNQDVTLDHLYRVQRARTYEFWLYRRKIMKKYLDYDTSTPLSAIESVSSFDLRYIPEWSHFWPRNTHSRMFENPKIPQFILDKYNTLLQRTIQAKIEYEEAGGKLESRYEGK